MLLKRTNLDDGTICQTTELPDDFPLDQILPGWEVTTREEVDAFIATRRAAAEQAAPPPPAPELVVSVTPLQMRRALNHTGLRSSVEAAVAGADQDTKDAWEFASEIRRDNSLLLGMATQLGMTEQQLDDLFALAATFQ